ncbi:Deoxyribonuclease CdiA [Carnimonas sp. R-84981]|uniref:VENN motif pre-toxin domain-containing protein n=1 Tax=Carnimonas bestiolae TaxID=3402172 RepID=UPI003EDBB7D0
MACACAAASAEALSSTISERNYHKSVTELTDDEKANLSSLTSLAAGLVGAATGDNASDALRTADSGKSAVENNYLDANQALEFDKELAGCIAEGDSCQGVLRSGKNQR